MKLYELYLICCTFSFNSAICFRWALSREGTQTRLFRNLPHIISLSQHLSHLVLSCSVPRFITDLSCRPGSAVQAGARCVLPVHHPVSMEGMEATVGLCCRAGLRGVEADRPGGRERPLEAMMVTQAGAGGGGECPDVRDI